MDVVNSYVPKSYEYDTNMGKSRYELLADSHFWQYLQQLETGHM